jgi:hypothetical protein
MTEQGAPTVTGFSALHIDENEQGHFYGERFVSPAAAERFVALAERDGLLVSTKVEPSYAVLDLLDAEGNIVADRHVPDEAAWSALNSELALSVVAVE